MKHSVLPFICCVALCLVAVEGLSNPAKQKLIKACKDRGAAHAICTNGVTELENGLAINDITRYLNTLGFQVPGHAGPALSLFWTGFAVDEVRYITPYLSLWEPKFFTSTNILPAAMMNDAGGPYSLGLTGDQQILFWAQFSAWMARSTMGNFAFWFTGGTTDAYFPSPCNNYPNRCFFEEYELPNLQVPLVVVLHLPQRRATASKSKCSKDRVSYNKLRTLNANLQYYCCELPAVDQYQGSRRVGVFNHISGIATALENDPTTPPALCIDLQQHFQPGKYSFARAFRGFLGRLRNMFTGRKKRDALGDIVCNHINTTLTGHVQNGKLTLSTVDTPTITYHSVCIPGICGTACVYVWGTCIPTPAYSACCSRVNVPSITITQSTVPGIFIGNVPSGQTLYISELFPATFEVGTPFNQILIEDLHYNCSSTKLYIKTRSLDTFTIIPGILELSSVTIELNATLSPVGVQRFVFSANWVIGSVNGNFAIEDNLEKGQLLLRGGPQGTVNLNFENMIESLSGKRISLPVAFRSVSFRDIEVVGEVDTFRSGSATFSISGRYGENNEAHVVLQKHLSNSGAKYAVAFAAEFTTFRFNDLIRDLTSVDISGFPYLGSLVVPTMAVTVSTASISSASLLEVFETSSLLRLSNVHIQGGVTTFFNVSNVPLKMSYFNREFSFEVLQGGSISLSVLLSKVGLSPDSVTQLRVPGINEILNLNIIHFSMNTSSREIQIALRFPNTLSYFNDLLKIQNVVVRVHALLNTQQQSVSGEVSGHVEIGGQFLEVVIKKDSTNNYMLSSKALQLNLSDITDRFNAVRFPGELNGVITASGLFDFIIRDMCIELTVGTQSSQLEISGSPAIQGYQAPELSALIVIEGSTYLIVGLKFGAANLANLIHSVSGFDLHSIAILNQQLEVAILVSPLSPTALQRERLSGLRITKGVSLEATITMSSTCSDAFCTAAKRLLGTNAKLMLSGTIMDTQSLYLFAGVSNISLGSMFTLTNAGFEVSVSSDTLKFGISGTLQISDPKINLTGAIRVGTNGIELELSTSDCWEKPFGAEWLTVCSLRGVVDLKPELDFLPGRLEIGGQVKIGKPSCGSQLSASGFIGLDADMPRQNYYYVHIKDSLTFESLLDRFCKDVDLPNALRESGFPEGFLSSFSLMGKELPHVPLSIPRGFQMKGKIDILGLTATTDININYPSSFKVVVLLPPLDLANGKLTMRASRNDNTRGPFLNASIHLDVLPPSVNIEASGYINVLDISHQAMLHITNEEYKFFMSGKMLNLFQASLNISASYGSIRTAAFQVHGRFTAHLCFKVEEAIESTINKTANGTTEAHAAAERNAKTTKTEYEDAQTERDNAQSEVGVCQAKFDTALSVLEDAREALRSICTPRNCDDVSWWTWPACQAERLGCIALREAPGLLVSQLEQKLETARNALILATSVYNTLQRDFELVRTFYNNAKSELEGILELERRAVEKIALHTLEEIINLKEITFDASLGVAATGSFSGSVSTCIEGRNVNLNIHVNLYDVISIARQIADYIIPGLSELF